MSHNITVGPIPPFNNPPINPQYFQPSRFVISDIVLGQTTTITTSIDHNYVVGQLVRLLIPPFYGCRDLNEKQGFVLSIPAADQVVIDLFSVGITPFDSTPLSDDQQPQILAIGDINSGIITSTGRSIPSTNIPGSFINISPN